MRKLRQCEEIVTGNGHRYKFAGTFGNIEAVSFLTGDPAALFVRLSEDKMPPGDIRNVIFCTLEEIDGDLVDEAQRDEVVTQFVEDFGLQDCSLLSRHLISHALIGNVKKKQIERREVVKGLTKRYSLSSLLPSRRPGLLWAAALIVLAVPACTIIR